MENQQRKERVPGTRPPGQAWSWDGNGRGRGPASHLGEDHRGDPLLALCFWEGKGGGSVSCRDSQASEKEGGVHIGVQT